MSECVMLLEGDVLEALRLMPDNSADAFLSDVPYGLGTREPTPQELVDYILGKELDMRGDFMNKRWNVPSVAVWREVYRVLKPGAPVLAFAGSRTHDLITLGMRVAGFEIADSIHWLYGQGMAKPATTTDKYIDWHFGVEREVVGTRVLTGNAAVDTATKGGTYGIQVGTVPPKEVPVTAPASPEAKRWEGYGHALGPGYEPITLAYKPYDGTIAENVLAHDVGGLNVAACRLSTGENLVRVDYAPKYTGTAYNNGKESAPANGHVHGSTDGRWPKNVILSHADACRPIGTREVRTGTAVKRNGVVNGGAIEGMHGLGTLPVGTPDSGYGADGREMVEAWACVPGCPIRELDEQSGDRPATLTGRAPADGRFANPGNNAGQSWFGGGNSGVYADMGGASRYFKNIGQDPCEPVGIADKTLRQEQSPTNFVLIGAPVLEKQESVDNERKSRSGVNTVASDSCRTNRPDSDSARHDVAHQFAARCARNANDAESPCAKCTTDTALEHVGQSASQDEFDCQEHTIRGTAHGCVTKYGSDIEQTLSIEERSLPGSQHSEHTQKQDVAKNVGSGGPIDTTTTTISRLKYGGYVEPAISGSMRESAARGEAGCAPRFRYQSKVSRAEREFGCESMPLRSAAECTDREEGEVGIDRPQAGAGRTGGARNFHPTLKPIALTRYLATLVLPPPRPADAPPRRILVPYAGTGSEIIGAIRAGWDEVVGIERDPEYLAIARARIDRWSTVPVEMDEGDAVREATKPDERQQSLF